MTAFDGDAPKRVVVQIWDSMEKMRAWRANPEYIELRKVGEKYAKFRSFAVDGLQEEPQYLPEAALCGRPLHDLVLTDRAGANDPHCYGHWKRGSVRSSTGRGAGDAASHRCGNGASFDALHESESGPLADIHLCTINVRLRG